MWRGIYKKCHVPCNPLLPPFIFVYSNQGEGEAGALALVPLSYASASDAAMICQPTL